MEVIGGESNRNSKQRGVVLFEACQWLGPWAGVCPVLDTVTDGAGEGVCVRPGGVLRSMGFSARALLEEARA
jgi:hypothetical protein